MSWTRRFMWAFWIFIAVMLIWQFYAYNQKLSTPDPKHPDQAHFFFYQPSHAAAKAAVVTHDGPYVVQTGFRVEDSTPSGASFTCHVTVKNTGKAKAVRVQVCVRPFRGSFASDPSASSNSRRPINGDEDAGPNSNQLLSDDSPLAQINQWVVFPDLAPDESSTQSAVFMKTSSSSYGNNPRAEITFEPEKK